VFWGGGRMWLLGDACHVSAVTAVVGPLGSLLCCFADVLGHPGTVTVNVPFATRLTVKMDSRCRTLDTHSIDIATPAASSVVVRETFSGGFGGKTVVLPGSMATVTYPVIAAPKRVPLKFNAFTGPANHFTLSNSDFTAECAVLKAWGTLRCNTAVTTGVFSWCERICVWL
jgi:hypothetical protein